MMRLIKACCRAREPSRVSAGRREGCARGSVAPTICRGIMRLACMHMHRIMLFTVDRSFKPWRMSHSTMPLP